MQKNTARFPAPLAIGYETDAYHNRVEVGMNWKESIEETIALRAASQRLRGEAVEAQLRACDVVCSFLQFELEMREFERVKRGLVKVRQSLTRAKRHVEEPGHVPSPAISNLVQMIARVEPKIAALEERLRGTDGDRRV